MWYTIDVPDQGSYQEVAAHLDGSGVSAEESEDGLLTRDPSGIGILLRNGT